MSIDLVEEELSVFKASATRMRWFISTAVLVSVLIILHIYVEQFSYQTSQLRGVKADWIFNHRTALRMCYADVVTAMEKQPISKAENATEQFHRVVKRTSTCKETMITQERLDSMASLSWAGFLSDYSDKEYTFTMGDNTLKNVELPIRIIPILGVQIPANDFVIVMALMSMVLVIGVWLSLRAIETSLRSLARHGSNKIMEIAQLNTVFLTISEFGDSTFATLIRTSSLWLPFISIVLATWLGYAPIFTAWIQRTDGYAGDTTVVMSFFYISVFISTVHFWIAWQCDQAMSRIDAVFRVKFPDREKAKGKEFRLRGRLPRRFK